MRRSLTMLVTVQACAFMTLLAEWSVRSHECLTEIGLKFGGSYLGRDRSPFSVRCHVRAQGAAIPTTTEFTMLPTLVAACGLLVCVVVTLMVRRRLAAEERKKPSQE
jgi:hypothetical protein